MNRLIKLSTFFICCFFFSYSSFAQRIWKADDLPFMPKRNPTHVRTMKKYVLSTQIMGKRTLLETTHYDRHGYETSPHIKLAFDSLGRLTDRMEMDPSFDSETQLSYTQPMTVLHVDYSPEGLVNYYREIFYSRHQGAEPDTIVTSCRLIDHTSHPVLGETKCVYRRSITTAHASVYEQIPITKHDTIVCERVYDGQNRLIQEYIEGAPEESYERYFYYNEQGRRTHRIRNKHEYQDSVSYQYNIINDLIGWSGKGQDHDLTFSVFVRCQPNGTPVQRTEIWDLEQYDEIAQEWMAVQSTYRIFFDPHGNMSRHEVPDEPYIEYDYTYWDE